MASQQPVSKTSGRGHPEGAARNKPAPPLAPAADPEQALKASELAAQFLADANDDRDRAAELLADYLLSRPALLRVHLMSLVLTWAKGQIGAALSKRREAIISAASRPDSGERLVSAMRNEFTRLMDMPLYGGKRLGEATAVELRESARQYAQLAKATSTQAAWQEKVAAAAEKNGSPTDRISAVLSEKTLAKLWEETNAD
jgi:hypothetical protein